MRILLLNLVSTTHAFSILASKLNFQESLESGFKATCLWRNLNTYTFLDGGLRAMLVVLVGGSLWGFPTWAQVHPYICSKVRSADPQKLNIGNINRQTMNSHSVYDFQLRPTSVMPGLPSICSTHLAHRLLKPGFKLLLWNSLKHTHSAFIS